MRFIFTLFKRNGDGFVLMNEQGYQFLECNKNYKESDDSDVLMTILISMVMVMMMVVMLIKSW